MKLATLPGDTPDGRLVVVSRDLARMAPADDIAPTLLAAVERWAEVEQPLTDRFDRLDAGGAEVDGAVAFDPGAALAPLPRAPQWLDGSVFETHLELMAQALHPEKPHEPTGVPLVYQGASDDLRGSTDPIVGYREDEGIDFEGEFGVLLGEVPMRVTADDALDMVRLVVLINDVSLRAYAGREVRSGFGFVNAKPSTAFAPVAVTPDELGAAWRDGRVELPLQVERSGAWFGRPNGREMTYHFGELIAHAARTRRLSAGTIVGSGTVSNADRSVGSACIAERRAIETIDDGSPTTQFLADGETVRMEVIDAAGSSVFGPIDQPVVVAD
jgi:fumarylacetoacetate (FAA) hydrolase